MVKTTETTHNKEVVCDGTFKGSTKYDASLGHPKVYLKIKAGETEIVCPYCSKKFVLHHEENLASSH